MLCVTIISELYESGFILLVFTDCFIFCIKTLTLAPKMRMSLLHLPVLKSNVSGWQWKQMWKCASICISEICCTSLFSNTVWELYPVQTGLKYIPEKFVLRSADWYVWLVASRLEGNWAVEEQARFCGDTVEDLSANWGRVSILCTVIQCWEEVGCQTTNSSVSMAFLPFLPGSAAQGQWTAHWTERNATSLPREH